MFQCCTIHTRQTLLKNFNIYVAKIVYFNHKSLRFILRDERNQLTFELTNQDNVIVFLF